MPKFGLGRVLLSWLSLAGCGHGDEHCERDVSCPVVDDDAQTGDDRFVLDDPRNSAAISTKPTFAGNTPEFPVTGEAVLSPPDCSPDAPNDCTVTIRRLRVTVADFSETPEHDAELRVHDATLSLEAPTTLALDSTGSVLVPAGTPVHTCATIDCRAWHGATDTQAESVLRYDSARKIFSIVAIVPLALRRDDDVCSRFDLWARVTASGNSAP